MLWQQCSENSGCQFLRKQFRVFSISSQQHCRMSHAMSVYSARADNEEIGNMCTLGRSESAV